MIEHNVITLPTETLVEAATGPLVTMYDEAVFASTFTAFTTQMFKTHHNTRISELNENKYFYKMLNHMYMIKVLL